MRRRIFIAINLPDSIKKNLVNFQFKWPELPCRWTKKENMHITLEFLGYLTDEELFELCQKTKKIAAKREPFIVRLTKICYGPTDKKPAKMVWAVGDKIKELGITPHITLGRLRMWEFRRMEPEERPEINQDIFPPAGGLSFEVNCIDVMESRLKRGGSEYTILASCPLKN